MTLDASKLPLISGAKCERFQGYDQVMIWSRGGYCGEIKVWSGDGEAVVERLMAPEVERVVDAMHAAVTRMRTETIEEVLEVLRRCSSSERSVGQCSSTGEIDDFEQDVVCAPLYELVSKIEALLPDEDQPIPYTLTDKGKEGVK